MSGWVRLSREILDWEWYGDANVCRVFVHLLLKANYKPSRYQGHDIPAGSLVAGVHSIAEQTGLTSSQVRTVFKKISGTEISIKTTNKFSIITITNWRKYQTDDKPIANKSQTDSKPIATSKEGKKERNISSNEDIRARRISTLEELEKIIFDEHCRGWFEENAPSVRIEAIREELVLYCRSKGKRYKDYWATMQTWARRKQEDRKNGKQPRKSRSQDLAEQAGELLAELRQAETCTGGNGIF